MNPPRCTTEDYIQFLLATPTVCSATEAARVQPDRPAAETPAPADDAVTRLLHRLEPAPDALWDEDRPPVCTGVAPEQPVGEVRTPPPARPGTPARYDDEYRREGVADLFMVSEPPLGWRAARVTERRTADDFAEVLRRVVGDVHPDAGRGVRVTDHPNTHSTGCPYEAFGPARARRVAERSEWHYTPEHGSWLNVAGCARAALSGRCPDRRIGSIGQLRKLVSAWATASGPSPPARADGTGGRRTAKASADFRPRPGASRSSAAGERPSSRAVFIRARCGPAGIRKPSAAILL